MIRHIRITGMPAFITTLAFLITGPLADHVFEPMMRQGGPLAGTLIGTLLGTGTGRGYGLVFVLSGLTAILVCLLALGNRRVRCIESELPDALPESPQGLAGVVQ